MNKPTFDDVKTALVHQRENIQYFTKGFYTTFCKAIEMEAFNQRSGIDDRYYDGRIMRRHAFDEVYRSRFYRYNSGAYCVFLQIMHQLIRA